MAGMRGGRLARRTRLALCPLIGAAWAALGAQPASADAAHPGIVRAAQAGPVDQKSTNILFEVAVGLGILVVIGVFVFLITRGRGRGRPESGGGGGGGGGNGYHPPPSTPPGGRRLERPTSDEEKSPALHGSQPQ